MELINLLNEFMLNTGIDYAVCGGHAIDLFLGRKTRPHKDLDVSIYWEDRDKIVQYMLNESWDLYEPCGGGYLHKINNVEDQKRLRSNIWCVKPENRHYKFTEHEKDMFAVEFDDSEQIELDYIEILFNTRTEKDFLFERNHETKIGLDNAIININGIPFLSPELVLLYKSTRLEEHNNQLDFENASKKLNKEQLSWLKNAMNNPRIRNVKPTDSEAILKIYAPFITETTISFETEVPSIEEFAARIENISKSYPYLVCEIDNKIVGFAYATKHRERAAYKYSADVSIYITPEYHRHGLGKALYTKLFELLCEREIYTVYAGITLPNDKSVGLHKSLGFKEAGVFHNVGYKFGKWLDVLWLEKPLKDYK